MAVEGIGSRPSSRAPRTDTDDGATREARQRQRAEQRRREQEAQASQAARAETRRPPQPSVNTDGQTVGQRIDTTA